MVEIKSSSHSEWNCKYHIVFGSKFGRKEIYGQLKEDENTQKALRRKEDRNH